MRTGLRRGVAAAAVVGVVSTGYAAYAAHADTPSYRTATASVGDVEQALDLSGTLEPAGRADLAFATSGTIEDVSVTAGEKVRTGQVLGALDDTTLRKDVQQARATLAAARAQLEDDESAQADAVSSASDTPSQPSQPTMPSQPSQPQPSQPQPSQPQPSQPSEPSGEPSQGPDLSDALADLAAEQQAVTGAQTAVSTSMAAADEALAAQQAACAEASQDCTDALTAVQAAQQQVDTDQDALQAALDALAQTLSDAYAELQDSQSTPPTPSSSASPAGATTGHGAGIRLVAYRTVAEDPATGSSGGTVTAATIARDQASIDQARADLVSAQQALRMATVRAPFAGEIVAVDAAEGDSVASGTEVFVLVARGTTTVEVGASSTDVQQLEVGQAASVTPTGSEEALAGTVTQVSSVPDDSSTYPVTITLKRKGLDLATGLTASVAVVTGSADDVVTVPASAVSDGFVTVIDDGAATRTRVTTGAIGATRVEVTAGLEAGDVVVLADLDRTLPGGDQPETPRGFVGGPGGVGGPPTVIQFRE